VYLPCTTEDKKDGLWNGIMQLFLSRGCLSLSLQHGKFFGMQKGWFWYTLFFVFQPLTQICTFKLLIPCRSISGEFDLKKILMNYSFSMTTYHHTHTQIWKHRKQSQIFDCSSLPTKQPRSCFLRSNHNHNHNHNLLFSIPVIHQSGCRTCQYITTNTVQNESLQYNTY